MSKKYIIVDYAHDKDYERYLAEESSSVKDIWWKLWKNSVARDERYTPKIFHTKEDAKLYLKETKRISTEDWNENSHIHKLYGYNKPSWLIVEYNQVPHEQE
jgi:hypothetical protein